MPQPLGWDLGTMLTLAALALGYLLGSIPFGLLLTRAAGLGDVRAIGSGNIGATNVLRTGNKKLAAATLIGDALKGTAAVLLAGHFWGPQAAILAGFAAFIGHIFPVWLGFRGGKGVATYLGVLIGLAWPVALLFALVWLVIAYLTRYSSLAALTACLAAPLALLGLGQYEQAILFIALAVLIFAKHRPNIARLLSGTESRIGQKG
jgi:glycerol-3-phosphate acyltransferase PlsY